MRRSSPVPIILIISLSPGCKNREEPNCTTPRATSPKDPPKSKTSSPRHRTSTPARTANRRPVTSRVLCHFYDGCWDGKADDPARALQKLSPARSRGEDNY